MKGAYKVLSSRQIDARLSTNGRINLRQQSCRHWNEGNASQVHCRSEPSQITNHAAAKGYNCIAEKRAMETLHGGQPSTEYLQFGDSVRIEMKGKDGLSLFGAIDQEVAPWGAEHRAS